MSDDDTLFNRAMHGVRKLETESRRQVTKASPHVHGAMEIESPSFAGLEGIRPEKSSEPWILKADGVSQERLRQLSNGRPPVDMEADLHGMTREQAFSMLEHCMQQALIEHKRVLCLVHGRGLHSQDGRPILKQAVYDWLADGPFAAYVLATVPKLGTRGGSCLVLLRKHARA